MTAGTGNSILRRSLLVLGCALASTAPTLGQDQATPPPPSQQQQGPGYGNHGAEMQAKQLEHLTKALNLSPDQVTQVKAIQLDGQQQMMAARQDTSVQGPDKRARMMALRQAQEARVRGVLTDEQKTRFDAMRPK